MGRIRWAEQWTQIYDEWQPLVIAVRDRQTGRMDAAALLAARASDDGVDIVAMGQGTHGVTSMASRDDRSSRVLAKAISDHLDSLALPWRLDLSQLQDRDTVSTLLARVAERRTHPRPVGAAWTFEGYASVDQLLSHNMRRQLRKARNRIETYGRALTFGTARTPESIEHVLDLLETIHITRDHVSGRESDLDDPAARGRGTG